MESRAVLPLVANGRHPENRPAFFFSWVETACPDRLYAGWRKALGAILTLFEFLSRVVVEFVQFLLLGSPGWVGPHTCPDCKSSNLFETGKERTRREPVGPEGAVVMTHYREYRCIECDRLTYIRID